MKFLYVNCFAIFIFCNALSHDNNIAIINSDSSEYADENLQCAGDVVVVYDNKVISADKIIYSHKEDKLIAEGNIVIKDERNNVYFAQYIEVYKKFTSGFANNIQIITNTKSRFAAEKCHFLNRNMLLYDAQYTQCYQCHCMDELSWLIRAKKVEISEDDNVAYTDAVINVLGYETPEIPHFSHYKSQYCKSGFLVPKISSTNRSGLSFNIPYIWALSDNQKIVFKPIISSKDGVIVWGSYGIRFKNGEFNIDSSACKGQTTTVRQESIKKDEKTQENKVVVNDVLKKFSYRGHVFSKFRYDFDQNWRLHADVNFVSDQYYLKRYKLLPQIDRVMESCVKLEGFDNRNYTSIRFASFQNADIENIPIVAPMIERNISTEFLNGTLEIDSCFLHLNLKNDRSAHKIASNISWEKQILLKYGIIVHAKLSALVEMLSVYGKETKADYKSFENITPQMMTSIEWPMFVKSDYFNFIYSPIIGICLSGKRNRNDLFEDTLSEINNMNFNSGNRSSSIYNLDSGDRVFYGMKFSLFRNGEDFGHITLARSFEFSQDKNTLISSGMEKKHSNILVAMDFNVNDELTIEANGSYSTQNKRWLRLEGGVCYTKDRYSIDVLVFNGKQFYSNDFCCTNAINHKTYKGFSIDSQVKITKSTSLKAGITFGDTNCQLMKYNIGCVYNNECTKLEACIERTNYRDGDLKPELAFRLIVQLKGFGN